MVATASRSNELHQVGSVQLCAGKPAAAGTLGASVVLLFLQMETAKLMAELKRPGGLKKWN